MNERRLRMRLLEWGWSRAMGPGALLALALALLLQPATSGAAPQRPAAQPPAEQQDPRQGPAARAGGFSAQVEMVRVPVVVVDEDGAFVRHLDKSNFTVRDDGTTYRIDHFVSDDEPATVGIIVDASAAMSPYVDDVRAGIMRAVNNLRPEDETFLISYGVSTEMVSPPSSDKSALALALARYAPRGAHRALFDAVELGIATLENATYDKRSLIVVGAGADTSSRAGELTMQQDLRRSGISVHAIVLADRPARGRAPARRVNRAQTLPEIARFTGGMVAQRPANAARFGSLSGWIDTAGVDISTYVKHQYLLHYAPLSPPRPGTWRSISVRLDVDYKEVRARSGYTR